MEVTRASPMQFRGKEAASVAQAQKKPGRGETAEPFNATEPDLLSSYSSRPADLRVVGIDEGRSSFQRLLGYIETGNLHVGVAARRELESLERNADILFANAEESADTDNRYGRLAGFVYKDVIDVAEIFTGGVANVGSGQLADRHLIRRGA